MAAVSVPAHAEPPRVVNPGTPAPDCTAHVNYDRNADLPGYRSRGRVHPVHAAEPTDPARGRGLSSTSARLRRRRDPPAAGPPARPGPGVPRCRPGRRQAVHRLRAAPDRPRRPGWDAGRPRRRGGPAFHTPPRLLHGAGLQRTGRTSRGARLHGGVHGAAGQLRAAAPAQGGHDQAARLVSGWRRPGRWRGGTPPRPGNPEQRRRQRVDGHRRPALGGRAGRRRRAAMC